MLVEYSMMWLFNPCMEFIKCINKHIHTHQVKIMLKELFHFMFFNAEGEALKERNKKWGLNINNVSVCFFFKSTGIWLSFK